jgi:hypothetical protein
MGAGLTMVVSGNRVRGDVDEAVDVVLCDGRGDAVGALDVDVLEVEVLGRVVAADKVEDHVRVAHALLNAVGVAQVVLGEDDAAQVARHLEMALGHLLAEGHHDGASLARESVDNVSSQESGGSEHGRRVSSQRAAAASGPEYGLAGAGNGDILLDAATGLLWQRDGGFGEKPGGRPAGEHCESGEWLPGRQWLCSSSSCVYTALALVEVLGGSRSGRLRHESCMWGFEARGDDGMHSIPNHNTVNQHHPYPLPITLQSI